MVKFYSRLVLCIVLLASIVGLWAAPPAVAATYTVTTTADAGPGSLRQAILDANANPGLDTVEFAVGAPGSQQTIALTTALPAITSPVILNGWSQGGSEYTGPPLVEINGSGISNWNSVDGLRITAGNSVIRGLVINYFNIGINLETVGNNVIIGSYLGLALNGDTAIGNRTGMRIAATSDNNRIGTDGDGANDAAERNVISASGFVQQNNSTGILIDQGSDNNWIAGNYIGTDATGAVDRGNASNGITTGGLAIIGTNGDGVGDDVEGNLISGNNGHGVALATSSNGSRVAGNKIGTDVTGMAAIPNNSNGVSVGSCSPGQCSDYIIGTNGDGVSDALEGNLISGNGADGVFIPSGTLDNNVVAGNKIGVDISGTAALPNGDTGVHFGGNFSRLGTNNDGISDDLEGNLISGNGDGAGNDNHGVLLPSGANHNVVAGNKIGVTPDGMAALPNEQTGIHVGDDFNTITNNLVSGNGAYGIYLYDAFFNTVTSNLIGTAADGVTALGNTLHGVYVAINSDNNTIGGAGAGEGNTIAFNGGDGVFVDSNCGAAFCIRNRIAGNAVRENIGLGIDLAPDGVTANDPLDADTGANSRQNYPVLTAAAQIGGSLVITGTLHSAPNQNFTVDFYSSSACDPTGFGEGALYLGTEQTTTDNDGDAAFTFAAAGLAQDGDAITATAADPDGNTSEFSSCVLVVGDEPITGLQAFNDSPTQLGWATHFTATLNTGTGVSYVWDFGDGATGGGATPNHMYTATGISTATVTASNSLGSATATTTVTILPPPACAATPDNGLTIFGSGDATALQQAVDMASPGDTVKIAGTCAGVSPQNATSQTVYVANALTLAGGYTAVNWTTPNPALYPTILDAQSLGRVVFIASPVLVTIETVILTNGNGAGSGSGSCPGYGCGGGVYTAGDLRLTNVTIQNSTANRGGGAYVLGALETTDANWLNNAGTTQRGGALEVYGDAALNGGLVQGNAATYGGGVFADAGLVIMGTQFISNTAVSPVSGSGGAVYAAGALDITNALFQGNQAYTGGGAVIHTAGTNEFLTIANTQFLNNTALNNTAQGGALYAGASASTIESSTFQGNSAPGSLGAGGAIVAFQAITLTETILLSNTSGGQGGAIYHWGLNESGSTTQVYPLVMVGSRLASNEAGSEGGGVYFRRGFAAENTPIQLLDTTLENNTAGLEGGGAYFGQPGTLTGNLFLENYSTTAAGGGLYTEDRLHLAQTTFQGNSAARAGGAYVTGTLDAIDTDWLDNAGTTQRGGALEVYGNAVLSGGVMQGNAATYGGGVFADAGLVINGGQFINNTATSPTTGSGGAVYTAGPLDISNALFQGNQAYTGAGAVLHSPGVTGEFLTIAHTEFVNNTALNNTAQGGALYAGASASTIQSSTFQGNSAPGSLGAGGAIVAFQAITLTETTLSANTSGGQGGAIYHWGLSEPGQTYEITPLTILNSIMAGNSAGSQGGGLYFRHGFDATNLPIQIRHTIFQENTAVQDGGGVYLTQPAAVDDSAFRDNTSVNAAGGGIFASSLLSLDRSTLTGNHAAANGGGLALQSSGAASSQITNTVFWGNTTGAGSASLYVSGTRPLDILHTTLAGADMPAQGIAVSGPNVEITNAILANHTTGILASGGAVVTADHTLFHGNQTNTQGATNLNPVYGDPQFLDAADGDFHLTLGSPAIDAAITTNILTDFEHDLRPIITQSDLGADEFGDSAIGDPDTTTIVTGTMGANQQIIILIPPGAMGGTGAILLLPLFPPGAPPPPYQGAGAGFQLQLLLTGQSPSQIEPTFLLPVEVTLTYTDADVASLDESSLYLAALDENNGEWVNATLTCSPGGTIVRNPVANQIAVTMCAAGEFALLGSLSGHSGVYLPLVIGSGE